MEEFKIGDRVIITSKNVSDKWHNREGVIVDIKTYVVYPYYVESSGDEGVFLKSELEHSKEHKVLEILRNAISKGVIGKTRV